MEYLLKASAVIFIFYFLYKLVLQRETFFQTNRLYLLIGLTTAICIPLIVIPIYIEYTPTNISNIVVDNNIEVLPNSSETTFDLWQLIYSIYGIGCAFFLTKLLIELTSLKFLFNKHQLYKSESFTLIETNDDMPPFSFFKWIVYNPKKYTEEELTHIINHEKVHAKELHSIDIILTQIVCVIFWFNPFIWLYKREVQQNLEFIADKKAQDFSECEKSYQLILLKSSVPNHKYLITNNFYNSQIKKRIIMLHKSKSNKLNVWKYALILPALAFFLMSFNTKEIFVEINEPTDLNNVAQTEASTQLNNFYDNIEFDKEAKTDKSNTSKQNNQKKDNKLITPKTPALSNSPKNNSKTLGNISITVINKNTTDAELNNIKKNLKKEGLTVKFKGVKRNSKNEITAIKIEAKSKKSNASYNVNSDEAIDTIKIVYDESKNSISIGNGLSNHEDNVFVYTTEDGNHKVHKSGSGSHVFVISEDEHEEHEYNEDNEHEYETKIIVSSNGKKRKIKKIKKQDKKVHVISGDNDNKIIEIIVDEDGNNEEEIIIVNGKKVNITKEKAKNVWITDEDGEEDIIILENSDNNNNIFISGNKGKDPLYILDGKEITKEEMAKIEPDMIESISVLKGDSAKEKYGKKGKNGVIVIKSKKKN